MIITGEVHDSDLALAQHEIFGIMFKHQFKNINIDKLETLYIYCSDGDKIPTGYKYTISSSDD